MDMKREEDEAVTEVESKIAFFIDSAQGDKCKESAKVLLSAFGGDGSVIDEGKDDALLSSFKRNLALLVQKTWVESTDAALKDSVLYRLDEFRKTGVLWQESYGPFLSLIYDAVYLMFGSQSREDDFDEWAMRIDPEFGTFWHFIASLPEKPSWDEEKYHYAIDCGMSFLANY